MQKINTEEALKYLGVRLDRTLTYRQYLQSVKNKIKTCNNTIDNLVGASWGSHANVLRTSALVLEYSMAEYFTPVCTKSAHCKKVDVQLNDAITESYYES